MNIHFYVLAYRYEALVASQLEPEEFGVYMATGTQKHTKGNVIFLEISPDFKNDYFRLENLKERCAPHKDGSPKRSKYISIYRVLEHIDISQFGKLYLTTADGRVMSLDPGVYHPEPESEGANLYQELCPVSPRVVSGLAPAAFTKFMTDVNHPVSLPKIFFADMLLDRDENGHLAGYLPYPNPRHILDCIKELESYNNNDKRTKTVSRNPRMQGFYRTIRRGFFLGDSSELKYYQFPSRRELEINHAHWWRSASESLIS